jgi:hypothetical protein
VIPVIRVDYSSFHDVTDMVKAIQTEYANLCNVRSISIKPSETE